MQQKKVDLQYIATIYRQAVDSGHPPTQAVANTLGIARSSAGRHVALARAAGYLPPADWGKHAAYPGPHHPRRVRWLDGSESWLVCAACRVLWPCGQEQEA